MQRAQSHRVSGPRFTKILHQNHHVLLFQYHNLQAAGRLLFTRKMQLQLPLSLSLLVLQISSFALAASSTSSNTSATSTSSGSSISTSTSSSSSSGSSSVSSTATTTASFPTLSGYSTCGMCALSFALAPT